MSDEETDIDRQPVQGEIVGPEGDGQWLSVPAASRLTGIPHKTLYRRIEHNQIPWQKNTLSRFEVWIPAKPPTGTSLTPTATMSGLDLIEVRELLKPLARELAVSRRESLTATERAVRAEVQLEAARQEIERLKEQLSPTPPERQSDTLSWWGRLKRWLDPDSQ